MKVFDRTYVEIDLQAIRHNLIQVRNRIKDETKIMAIVKANAYGHGAIPVAKAIENMVDAYGVAMIEEALELREAGFSQMILILGYTGEEWFEEVINYRISQTIYTYDMAKKLSDVAVSLGKDAYVHIKLDTGMGRIGFQPTTENVEKIKQISELPGLKIEGIFTHFARADEDTTKPVEKPLEQYMNFVHQLEEKGVHIPIKHVSNSASIINLSQANFDMVRTGIINYGLYPSEDIKKESIDLKPAMQWKSMVSFVKEVAPGTSISYGGTFVADKEMLVATIPVGYADGMKRDLSGKGQVLIHGEYAPILGRVCMDQFMVDVTDIPDVKMGDEVTIFGKQGEQEISVEQIASQSHSFNYEFVCNISQRVPRKYIEEQ